VHKKTDEPLFQFHGHAVGFSGRLTRPFDVPVDAIASCALPPSGGYASARSGEEGYRMREIVRVGRVTSQVTGSKHEGEYAWNTVCISTIEGLDILGQVTADRITAVLSVKRPFKGDPVFSIAGSRFENLRIAGERVEVEFHSNVERWAEDAARRDPKFSVHTAPPGFCLVTTAVSNAKCSRVVEAPHIVEVPQFGRIVLGEYWITPYSRSLTMFRAEMGCGFEGMFEGPNVGGNGVRYPPYP